MNLPNYTSTILNIFLILLLILLIYRGYKKGFITQVIGLFSLLLSAVVAWFLYVPFGKMFEILPTSMVPFQSTILSQFFYIKLNSMLWFVIIFIVAYIIIKFVTKVLDLISKAPLINIFNRLLGVVFSLINFVLIIWLIIFGLSLPLFTNGDKVIEQSLLKYNKPIIEKIDLVLIENPINQLQALQEIMKLPNQADEEDISKMQSWLIKNKVSIDDISEFFKELKGE